MKKLRVNMVSESDVLVQGHGVHTAYLEMASALEKRDDVEVIRGEFNKLVNCDVYHLHTIGGLTYRKVLQRKTPKVMSVHVVPASFLGSLFMAKYWLFVIRWYMRLYYNRADKLLAVSQTVADTLEKELWVPARKIEVFYNTIDMSRYTPSPSHRSAARTSLGIPEDAFMVIGNGQVQPRKRLDVFIRMAKELPDVTFVWIGGIPFKNWGADIPAMNALMKSAPSNLKITGIIPHGAVRDYLAAADVFCLPAEQENHPMAVLEAAGAGLPIVLRDIHEYDDTFGSDGLRCTDDTFTDAIKTLRTDKNTYDKYKIGAANIARRFDSSAAAERLVSIYQQLL